MFNKKVKVLSFILATVTLLAAQTAVFAAPHKAASTTFKIWHYESPDSAMGVAWNAAVEEFKTKHPDVTVQLEVKSFEQIRQTANMILNSDQAPDIMESNKGNASAGLFAKEGLLTDLSDVAKQRGWDKILPPSIQTTCLYDENGIMGTGKLYGVTDYGEYVMVFYNKDMFKKYNITVPTTFAEYEAALDKFQKAGVTPLALGGAEYPGTQVLYELALYKADRKFVNNFQLFQGDVDFHGPEFSYAADKFQEWVTKGYIAKTSNSQKGQDMGNAFIAGTNPMIISGSWWFGGFVNQIKGFDWGMFLLPGKKLNTGSGGNLWIVPSGSQNKDLAYDFIDITLSKANQTALGNAGGIPINADISQIKDAKVQELNKNFGTIVANDGLAFYPDWPVPGFYDVLVSASQDIISGKPTAGILDKVGKYYADNKPDASGSIATPAATAAK
jgi:raffinose/stachyose/melibiose transport system substrate-binding protein